MSKIRNLIDKIFKKNKSSQDLDDIFDDHENYEESEETLEALVENDHIAEDEDILIDVEEEVDIVNENFIDDEILDEDFTATTDSEIDLDSTEVTLKDKVDLLGVRIKDKFTSLRTKDLNKAFKKPGPSSSKKKIDLSQLKGKATQINWGNIPNEFFSKDNRNKLHKTFQVSLLLASLFVVTKIASNFIQGTPDYKKVSKSDTININTANQFSKDDLEQIKSAQVFKTDQKTQTVPKKTINTTQVCKKATRKSRVNVKLVNTIVLQDSVKSMASVQIRSERALKQIREGENLLSKIKIDRIERLRLIVKNLSTGECEYIENAKFEKANKRRSPIDVKSPSQSKSYKKQLKKISGIENDGNNFKIKKDYLKDKLSNIQDMLTQAKGIPLRNPDGSYSFKIVDIEPGGVFSYLGVEDGDVISEINGEPIRDMNEVMNLFGKVSTLSKLNLTINRSGESVTQNYTID